METVLQKIEKIISNVNLFIEDNIDPKNTDAILNAKFGMIDSCVKELAKSIDAIK